MLGTLVNVVAIILGSIVGLIFHAKISQRYITIVFQGIGLFTLFVGVAMALKTNNYLILIFSIVVGGLLGTWLKIEHQINAFSVFVKLKVKSDSGNFSEGLITAFLLYCMGSMTILGSFEEGLGNTPNLLFAKALMDGIASIALTSGLGIGVMFSVIPLLVYQGGLTLLAKLLSDRFSEPIINELSAVGGLLLIGMGLNILDIAKIKVINMIPALIVVIILSYFFA